MPPVPRTAEDGTQEDEFAETPQGFAQLWKMEFDAARDNLKKWRQRGKKIDERFRDEREPKDRLDTRWSLFAANVRMRQSALYGKVPQVSVDRRFADAKDDVARLAGAMMERLLNTDIERDGDGYALAVRDAAQDYLLPGLGNARVRYVLEEEETEEVPERVDASGQVMAAAIPAGKRKVREDVEVDYVHWQDQLWSPCRVWQEARWWAFRAETSRATNIKRFGKKLGSKLPLNAKKVKAESPRRGDEASKLNPWGRTELWEIWDKERKRVFWYVEGFPQTLGPPEAPEQGFAEDPLELSGFWPFPRPLAANTTTTGFVPVPDFILAQDLYNEIDRVSTKISELQDALKVAGVYDSNNEGIQQLLENGGRNILIPVKNWGRFAEGGGLKGVVDWLPIEQIAIVMDKLRDYRVELIQALDQIEGTSDLMRGQAADASETATAQGLKARFGSIRIQAQQDEVARFAGEVLWLKAQLIAKFFDEETILERSNAQYMFDDPALAQQAVALIKDRLREYRVQVRPENVAIQDFAALKQEALEVLEAIANFIMQVGGLAQQAPGSMPFLLELLQWALGRLRGAATAEGILDRAIEAAKQTLAQPQQAAPQQPDPRVVAAQAKQQADQQKAQLDEQRAQADFQRDVAKQQMEVQAQAAIQQKQTDENLREERGRLALKNAARAQEQLIAPPGPAPLTAGAP